jgi:ABC-type multidrug transport system ATPase subunit
VPALAVDGLGKRFGARWALRSLSFALEPGEACALVGPNGAGKTTLLRCLATLARPTEGTVRVAGVDALEDGAAARARLGYAGDQPRHYAELSVEENLRFAARFHPGGLARVPRLLGQLGLAERAREPARSLSRGMAQRLALARALLGQPAVLLLDEPFAPLDAASLERAVDALAYARSEGTALLFSSQRLDAAPRGTPRALLLRDGQLAADARGGLDELRARALELTGGKA